MARTPLPRLAQATISRVEEPRRRRQRLIRWLWAGLTLVILGLAIASISPRFMHLAATVDRRTVADLGFSRQAYAAYITTLDLLVLVTHMLIAAFIVWRRSDERVALFVAFALLTNGAIASFYRLYDGNEISGLWRTLLEVVTVAGLSSSVILPYIFPDGRFVPRGTVVLSVIWTVQAAVAVFLPNLAISLASWPPYVQGLVLLLWAASGMLAQLYRYANVSGAVQRQQTKWALAGLTAAVLGPLGYFVTAVLVPTMSGPRVSNVLYQRIGASFFSVSFLYQLAGLTLLSLLLIIFPLSFAIAILRYRLWEIDIIIHRTMVYTMLTGLLMFIYVTSVVLLESVFRLFAGDGTSLAVVVSTLTITGLFAPLRRRVQDFIDRRFYRRRYDAQKILTSFARSVRDEVELQRLAEEIISAVGHTMQPAHLSLWLRGPLEDRRT